MAEDNFMLKIRFITTITKEKQRMPVNYQNGKIYSIRSRSRPDLVYVGSTTQPLSVRFGGHKKSSNRSTSKQIIDIGDAYIELIENYSCNGKDELCKREGEIMRSMECVNKNNPIFIRCPHNRIKSYCKECGGSSICSHNRQKSQCKECGGSQICSHNRVKSACKECGGSSICSHNREKSYCKDCIGSQICSHNRRKTECKDCGGASICIHNRYKSKCKDCGGSQICSHNRRTSSCKDCGNHYCKFCDIKFCGNQSLKYHNNTGRHIYNYIHF